MSDIDSEPPPSVGPASESKPWTKPWARGWRPADDDHGALAVAYRAERGERMGRENRVMLKELRKSIDGLSGTIAGARAAIDALAYWLKIAGAAVVSAGAVGAALWLWRWLSTLHH